MRAVPEGGIVLGQRVTSGLTPAVAHLDVDVVGVTSPGSLPIRRRASRTWYGRDLNQHGDSWRASEPEAQRRAVMAPYVVEEREGFYHGRELAIPISGPG